MLVVVDVLVEVVVDVGHGFVRDVGSANIDLISFSFLKFRRLFIRTF